MKSEMISMKYQMKSKGLLIIAKFKTAFSSRKEVKLEVV
jgi:hypothetical protein